MMFVHTLHLIRRSNRLTAALVLVLAALSLLALSTPLKASAAAGETVTPVGAVRGATDSTAGSAGEKRGMGALLPREQVNPDSSKSAAAAAAAAALPASVDLSTYSVPVGDQGQVGSCVAWTIDYAMLGWYSKRYNRPGQPFNPMYTYSQIRVKGLVEPNGGSYPKDAFRVAIEQGNDTMAHYSHGTSDYVSLPNASELANAANYKIAGSQTLFANISGYGSGSVSADLIKTALAAGKPVAISMIVRQGFRDMARTSTTLDTDTTSQEQGRHEVMATGYDASGLWIQNSWGTGWGYNGYGRLSWAVVGQDVYQADTITGFAATPTADTTPPTMGAVTQQFQPGGQIASSTVPVQFAWSATDTGGISAYEVWVKTDTGAFLKDANVAANATYVRYSLTIGKVYQVAVKAKDAAGNWSSYSYSVTVKPGIADDKTFSVGAPWARYSLADTYGGTYTASSKAGSGLQYTATGRDLAVIGPQFSTAGRATLYCDGISFGLIDAYSATTVGRKVVAWCHFLQTGQHTIKIVLEGTSGRPWFGIDAFVVLS